MGTNHELLHSTGRRVRRVKKASGRMVVSALGFGIAYYFDPQNGEPRRRRLVESLETMARRVDRKLSSGGEDPPPLLYPVRQALRMVERREPLHSDRVRVAAGP